MPFFDLLEPGLLRAGHVVHDGGDDASVRGMVLFDGQDVGAFAIDDGLGCGGLRVERVRRDDGVFQVKASQQLGDVGDFVAFRVDRQLSNRNPVLPRPGIQDMD